MSASSIRRILLGFQLNDGTFLRTMYQAVYLNLLGDAGRWKLGFEFRSVD